MRKTPLLPNGLLLIEEYLVLIIGEDAGYIALRHEPLDPSTFHDARYARPRGVDAYMTKLFALKRTA